MARVSAGILCFRRVDGGIEVLVAHPGGPFWAHRDDGAWTIPKGELDAGEDALTGALREFAEEIGLDLVDESVISLGSVTQRSGKVVHAFGIECDVDVDRIDSNHVRMERPRGSGRMIEFPEIDRAAWVSPETAVLKLNPAQADFIPRLLRDVR